MKHTSYMKSLLVILRRLDQHSSAPDKLLTSVNSSACLLGSLLRLYPTPTLLLRLYPCICHIRKEQYIFYYESVTFTHMQKMSPYCTWISALWLSLGINKHSTLDLTCCFHGGVGTHFTYPHVNICTILPVQGQLKTKYLPQLEHWCSKCTAVASDTCSKASHPEQWRGGKTYFCLLHCDGRGAFPKPASWRARSVRQNWKWKG